jgi:hypothetical protein
MDSPHTFFYGKVHWMLNALYTVNQKRLETSQAIILYGRSSTEGLLVVTTLCLFTLLLLYCINNRVRLWN